MTTSPLLGVLEVENVRVEIRPKDIIKCPHCTRKEMESQSIEVICQSPYGDLMARLRLESILDSKSSPFTPVPLNEHLLLGR